MRCPAVLIAWCSFVGVASAGEQVIPLVGEVPDDGLDHFFVPFEVPEGTLEIEVRHDDGSVLNVLDWGLDGPDGFRGWGGGNGEAAIVSAEAASRSYIPGPIEPGTWRVVVGKASITDPPGSYAIEVVLRDLVTLPPQTRSPYVDADALVQGPAWYAGDFHVHSEESGDARPELAELGTFARDRGLDFVVITDHNVHTAQDFFGEVQPDHPGLLFVPGVEFTTYAGHANAVGATQWVDHKLGQPGVTLEGAIAAYHDQGALFSINHPVLELGALCIGCAWAHEVDGALVDAVEIATGGLQPFGAQFSDDAIAFWDALCAQGHHVAALGGSDDHKAGVDLNQFQSPIGDPTTLVLAARLDVPSILEGVRDGRTVVKLQGPDDPTLMFAAVEAIDRDTIRAPEVTLTAQVLGGAGQSIRLVHNGEPGGLQAIDADPFEAQWTVPAPAQGQDRYRVEIFVDDERRVVSSHLWVEDGPGQGGLDSSGGEATGTTSAGSTSSSGGGDTGTASGEEGAGADGEGSGCGCVVGPRGSTGAWLLGLLVLAIGVRRRAAASLLLLLSVACGDDLPSSFEGGTGQVETTHAATTGTTTTGPGPGDTGTVAEATSEAGTTGPGTGDTGTSTTGPDLPPVQPDDGILLTRMASWPGGGLELTVALEDAQGFALGEDRSGDLGLRWTDDLAPVAIAAARNPPDPAGGHLLIMIAPEPTAVEHEELLTEVAELITRRPLGERIALYRWGPSIDQMVGFTHDRELLARVLAGVPMGTAKGSGYTPAAALEEATHQVGRVDNDQARGLRWALIVGRGLPGEPVDIGTDPSRSVLVQWVFRELAPADLDVMGHGRAVDWLAAGGLAAALVEAEARVASFRDAFYDVGLCGVPLEGREAELTLRGQDDGLVTELEGGAPEDRSPSLTASCDPQTVLGGARPYPEVIDFAFTPEQWNVYQQRLATGSDEDFALSVGLWPDGPQGVAVAHLRGQSSFWCGRRNYTLDLDTNTARHLLPRSASDEFYLLSMCLDDRYVRAYTVYQLYAQLGVFPLEFRFVELRLDGQTRGVYMLVEKAKEALVDDDARVRAVIRRGFSGGFTYPDIKYTSTTEQAAIDAYELLLSELDVPSGEALFEALDDRLDRRGYLTLLAMNALLQNGDYVDESWLRSTEHLQTDGTVGDWYRFIGWDPDDVFSSCHYGGGYAYPDPYELAYCAESEIDDIILRDAVTYERYVDVLEVLTEEVTDEVFDQAADATEADLSYYLGKPGVAAAMTELVQANPAAVDPAVAQAEVLAAVGGLKSSFHARRELILERIATYRMN